MGNDLRRGKGGDAPAIIGRKPPAIAVEEAGSVEIPGPGGVDDPADRRGIDHMGLLAGEDEGTLGAAGERHQLAMAAGRLESGIEALDLPEGADLRLIGEEDVDMIV